MPDRGWGRGAAGEASAGLKIAWATATKCRSSRASLKEPIDKREKQQMKGPTKNYTMRCKTN